MNTVLITGASRGIGAAIAEVFARHGYQLILNCCHSETALKALSDELSDKYHVTVLPVIGDVSDPDFIANMFAMIHQQSLSVDVLINNAGISHIGLLQDMTYEQWQHVINTNLSLCFFLLQICSARYAAQKKSGRILNISSVWGNVGASCEVAYSASKGAVNSFTKALAKEVAPSGISVNAIACGTIDTSMNACFSAEERADLESEIPCGRYGTPVETAELAYAIVSQSPYLTGQIITLDGGWC